MVDFDLINSEQGIRISVGAVDVTNGPRLFRQAKGDTPIKIGPEHIMASAALPPGFPAVKIGHDYFWDGGLTSNTPLDHVLRAQGTDDLLIFQLDLFSAAGCCRPRSAKSPNAKRTSASPAGPRSIPRRTRRFTMPQGAARPAAPLPDERRATVGRCPRRPKEHRHGDPSDLSQRAARGRPRKRLQFLAVCDPGASRRRRARYRARHESSGLAAAAASGRTMVTYELTQDNHEPVKRMTGKQEQT